MKKKIVSFLTLILLLSGCSNGNTEVVVEEAPTVKYVETELVKEKDFAEQLKLPGKVSASKETSISSLSSGIIDRINAKVGDTVKAGDILATIDTTTNLANTNLNNAIVSHYNAQSVYNATKASLDKTLESAKIQLDNAQISYQNTMTSTEKQLELAKAQLDSVTTQKGNTATSSDTSLELARKSLENAELALSNFIKNSEESLKSLDTKRDSLIKTIQVTVDGSFVSFDTMLNEADKLLGVTDSNRSFSETYEMYLSSKNVTYKSEAKNLFSLLDTKYKQFKQEYQNAFSSGDIDSYGEPELLAYFEKLLSLVTDANALLDKIIAVLNNSVSSDTLPEASLAGLKSSFATMQGQFTSLKATLVSLQNQYFDIINSISSTNTNLETQKISLELSVKVAQSTYENTQANINANLDNVSSSETTTKIQYESTEESVKAARETAANALKLAENQYTSAKANYDAQLASLKAQVDSASGQKNALGQQVSNSQIKAPYDGIIIERNIEIGTTIGQGGVAFKIANSNEKIVKMDVNADNAKYLNVGTKVKLTKGNIEGEGTITIIGAGSTNSMHPIEISINDAKFASELVLGDFLDVYINKEIGSQKQIIIPFSSLVAGLNSKYHVFVVDANNVVEEKQIEIGSSNSNEVIVTSGLNIGDKLIVSGALNVKAGDAVEER